MTELDPGALQGQSRANLTPCLACSESWPACLGACCPLPGTAPFRLASLGHRCPTLLAFAKETKEERWRLLESTASDSSSPWSVPSSVLVQCGVTSTVEPPKSLSPHKAGLPVDGIMHDEHFVLVPGPFFFLQQKKLKMSTLDAALEIKDRAETVQRQTREALVTALLLFPCSPLLSAGSCWGPVATLTTSYRAPRVPFAPASGLVRPCCRTTARPWPIPAHPSCASQKFQESCMSPHRKGRGPAAPGTRSAYLLLLLQNDLHTIHRHNEAHFLLLDVLGFKLILWATEAST